MKQYKKYLMMLFLLPLFCIITGCSFDGSPKVKSKLNLSPKTAKAIGMKIWQNECLGEISGLTSWNKGENFASLGIGHCIWYPAGKQEIFVESFPTLIRYMHERHVAVPKWLNQSNPWQSREEFLRAIKNKNPRMEELRKFLVKTIPVQTQYLIYRLEKTLPKILKLVPESARPNIKREINQLMRTPRGIYALVDYVNFKGGGTEPVSGYASNWGLLQVLMQMQYAPKRFTPNEAFAWAAGQVLKRRAANAPPQRKANDERWLPGWLKRVNTYK
ncbi:MAG: hypothetical protein ACD_21C00060G0001 [uncultured bacterium]|nr:MAG: hypothetical protein ACD_21C00060G0001 [uncultured bacterium]